jgi:hypothetical protein
MKHTLLAAFLVLPCLALPALADPAPTATGAPPKHHNGRVTWTQKFAQANSTHDGHLTAEQAKAGYSSLFRHFAEIDTGNKGFVTVEDVKAWHKQRRTNRNVTGHNPLRHHASHHTVIAPPVAKATTSQNVSDHAPPGDAQS